MRIKAAIPFETREGFIADLPGLPVTDSDGNQIGTVVEAHYIAAGGQGVIELSMDVQAGSLEVETKTLPVRTTFTTATPMDLRESGTRPDDPIRGEPVQVTDRKGNTRIVRNPEATE